MKSNELKEIIRSIIKEELNKTLPSLIPKILSEILSGKQSSVIQSNESTVATKTVVKESVQKPIHSVNFQNTSKRILILRNIKRSRCSVPGALHMCQQV